jgi:TonB family protein
LFNPHAELVEGDILFDEADGAAQEMIRLVFFAVALSVGATCAASPESAQTQALVASGLVRLPAAIPSEEDNTLAIKNHHWCAVYPPIAVRLAQEGNVALSFAITAQGTVTDVKVTSSSGHDALDEVSIRCATTWRFQSAAPSGNPVTATSTAEFVYSLKPPTIRSRDQAGVVTEFHPQFPWTH